MKYSDEQLAGFLQQELTLAEGSELSGDALASEREKAWDYYLGRERSDVPALRSTPGRSSVKSLDVHDLVNAILAQVMPAFSTDVPAMFEPDGPDDEAQAEAESMVVNRVLMEDNQGYSLLYQAVKDALLFKNGILKVWAETVSETIVERHRQLDDEQIALLEGEGFEVVRDGESFLTKKTVEKPKVLVDVIDPGSLIWQAGYEKQTFDDARFVAERKLMTRADLIRAGFPESLVSDLQAYTTDVSTTGSTTQIAKRLDKNQPIFEAQTPDQDMIEIWECYLRIDMSGGLEDELWRIMLAGRTILDKQPVQFAPYAMGTAWITPHRASGESAYQKAREVQDQKTAVLRAWMDNLNTNNHARLIVGPSVNTDDLAISGPNRHVRADDVSQVVPIPIQDTGPSAQAALAYLDTVASHRVGAALDLQSGDAQLLQSSTQIGAGAANSMMAAMERQAECMTRTLSETLLRNVFLMIHRVLRTDFGQPVMIRLAGQWQSVDTSQFRPRTRLNVKTGLSPTERSRKIAALAQVVSLQTQLLGAGLSGQLVDLTGLHRALKDLCRAQMLDGEYFVDPQSEAAQKAAQAAQQQAEKDRQQAMALQTLTEQVKLQIAQLKDQTDRLKIIVDADAKEAEIVKDIEIARQSQIAAAESAADRGRNGSGQG